MGDPRAARSRELILTAARSLLVDHGPGSVTHLRVAERAGVGRATVYRHWPQAEQLLLDAMGGVDMPFVQQPEVPVRAWMARQLRKVADELAMPQVAVLTATLTQGASWDPGLAQRRDHFVATISNRLATAVAAAVAGGELDTPPAATDVMALLIGPIHYRITWQDAPVPDEFIDHVLNSIGRWHDPSGMEPRRSPTAHS